MTRPAGLGRLDGLAEGLAAFARVQLAEHDSPTVRNLLARHDIEGWSRQVLDARGCAKPIRLSGKAALVDAQGAELDTTDGPIFTPCKNRRATVCESCSAHYAHDTFHLVRAGLSGGKGVPETVTDHVQVLATLTAPSFGSVHSRPERHGTVHRCRCGTHHAEHDRALGTPLNPETYDYVGQVLWQAHAGELWRRFTIATARALARHLGVAASRLREHLRLSYAKVAEYQRRGVVHFHAVVRIDGPEGPDGPTPPSTVTRDVLTGAIRHAAATVTKAVDSPHTGRYDLAWGDQVDVAPIHHEERDDGFRDRGAAGYVAKYATKGTGLTVGADHPIRNPDHIELLDAPEHAKELMRTAWRLGGVAEFDDLNLRKWAHMLGFRGHFLTKSRLYSTTFTAIRRTRAEYRLDQHRAALGLDDGAELRVVADWEVSGIGYRTDAERTLAALLAELHLASRRLDGQNDDDPSLPDEDDEVA